jgi:hypothetical protein
MKPERIYTDAELLDLQNSTVRALASDLWNTRNYPQVEIKITQPVHFGFTTEQPLPE